MIRFEAVSHTYRSGEHEVPALGDVSLSLHAGEAVAVLGPNGSGKSTLVRLANGTLLPTSGRVVVGDHDTADPSGVREVRTAVGVVYQRPDDQIVATSVEDDVAFGPENLGLERGEIRRRVDEALAAVGLTGLERREPHLLSGGQKQRLAIAGALAMSPRFMVFDEPTSMIDTQGRLEVHAVLRRLRVDGHGVLLVTHDLVEAALCDRVVVLGRGRIVHEGPAAELLSDIDGVRALGLEPSPLVRLAAELRRHGVPVPPGAATPAEVVDALCR